MGPILWITICRTGNSVDKNVGRDTQAEIGRGKKILMDKKSRLATVVLKVEK